MRNIQRIQDAIQMFPSVSKSSMSSRKQLQQKMMLLNDSKVSRSIFLTTGTKPDTRRIETEQSINQLLFTNDAERLIFNQINLFPQSHKSIIANPKVFMKLFKLKLKQQYKRKRPLFFSVIKDKLKSKKTVPKIVITDDIYLGETEKKKSQGEALRIGKLKKRVATMRSMVKDEMDKTLDLAILGKEQREKKANKGVLFRTFERQAMKNIYKMRKNKIEEKVHGILDLNKD